MLRVRRVAYAGAIVMLGVVGCTAQAGTTPTPTASPTVTASPTTTVTRQNIDVRLNPDRVSAGDNSTVWILANCPVPLDGPEHSGTGSSTAFISDVVLDPVPPPTPTARPTATATTSPAPVPWVRGDAQISGTIKRGTYDVSVKCEGTNDTGTAKLRVVNPATLPSDVPTRAPEAGGGGTFAQGADDEGSGVPLAPAGALIGLALAGGIWLAVKRRRA